MLAIDPGTRRVGVALSDAGGKVALPLEVIPADAGLIGRLAGIAADNGVAEIVVGLPRKLDGTDGPQAQSARRLAIEIERKLALPVRLVDERLTSAAAERAFDEGKVSGRRRRGAVDKVAAALLLQGYLDGRRSS